MKRIAVNFIMIGMMVLQLIPARGISANSSVNTSDIEKNQSSLQTAPPIVDYSEDTGMVTFISGTDGAPISLPSAKVAGLMNSERASAILAVYAPLFGIKDPIVGLTLEKSEFAGQDRIFYRYQQIYNNIPIMAGEIILDMATNGDFYSMSGEASPNLALATLPKVPATEAQSQAIDLMENRYGVLRADFTLSKPELWIYDERLLRSSTKTAELVWRMEARATDGSPYDVLILVDALHGGISLHFNQTDTSWTTTKNLQDITTPNAPALTPTPVPASTTQPTEPPLPQGTPTGNYPNVDQDPIQTSSVTTRYVSPSGNDSSNTCTALISPCKTIQKAINSSASGDFIKVAVGTYTYTGTGNPTPNVVIINSKSITLSGGWDTGFSSQTDVSTIDGENVNNGILAVSSASIILVDRFIIQNSVSSNSGGLYISGANFTLQNSTVMNNHANGNGAGIFAADNANVTLLNTSVVNNSATSSGGGISLVNGTVIIRFSTIAKNQSGSAGGAGLYASAGATIKLDDSIVAGNSISSSFIQDCNGTITSQGFNIISNTNLCTITPTTGDKFNVDPLLSSTLSLTRPVYTLLSTSPAIDAASNTTCPAVDEVGTPRPVDGDANGLAVCDIGAYEYFYRPPSSISINSGNMQQTSIGHPFNLPLSAIVRDSLGDPVPGAEVTFTAPVSGAGASFAGSGTNSQTVITDLAGVAASSNFTANDTIGSFTVSASVAGIATSANFSLTNKNIPGIAVSIAISSGNGQIARINHIFNSPLSVLVLDDFGNPVSAAQVTFTAPANGATCTFTGSGSNTQMVTTNLAGIATSSSFLSNVTVGSYNVSAAVSGLATTANFSLTNRNPGQPANISYSSGSGQIAPIDHAFGSPLAVLILDSYGDPASGAEVTFTGPADGPSGTFAATDNISETALSGSDGIATSSIFKANGLMGTYNVSAGVSGVASTIEFSLRNKNLHGTPVSISISSGSGQIAPIDHAFGSPLAVLVLDDFGDPAAGTEVTFTGPADGPSGTFAATDNISETALTGSDGIATSSVFTANELMGTYNVSAGVSGVASTVEFTLRNKNLHGTPVSISISSGSGQIAPIDHAFGSPLAVMVLDDFGDPAAGTEVTFTGPADGPSGTFAATDNISETALTGSDGIATSSVFTANGLMGIYNVSAGVSGVAFTVEFTLRNKNLHGTPVSISISSGSGQIAPIDHAFGSPLVVLVLDDYGDPAASAEVTFTAPDSGPSGTFAATDDISETALTGSDGIATSSVFTANELMGTYDVSARASGVASTVDFSLRTIGLSTPVSIVVSAGSGQVTPITQNFDYPLVARVLNIFGDPISGVSVTFTAPAAGASGTFGSTHDISETVQSGSNGIATSSVIKANNTLGTYHVDAAVAGVTNPAVFTIQNLRAVFVTPNGNDANSCTIPAEPCATINAAISKANSGENVFVASGNYLGSGTAPVVTISKNIILGGGWNGTFESQNGSSIIDGNSHNSGMMVPANITATVEDFIIQNGHGDETGGGITNAGNLSLKRVSIQNNLGIAGGIYNADGSTLMVDRSSITFNEAFVTYINYRYIGGNGGGIYNDGTAKITNTTIANNTAAFYGGGVFNEGYPGYDLITLNNVTIAYNYSHNDGGGFMSFGNGTMGNTIISNNDSEYGPDCSTGGGFQSTGYNIIGSFDLDCNFTSVSTDRLNIDPDLDALVTASGSTSYFPLRSISPAIDHGNPAAPGSGGSSCEATDQRGISRPVGGGCDIGAFEGSLPIINTVRAITYTANYWILLPGTFVCNQDQPVCTNGVDPVADAAQSYAIDTYNFFLTHHHRNSMDNVGMTIQSSVHYSTNYDNAFWNGNQMVYGDAHGYALADDVVAHELSHGVTQFTSNLFYYYQSGAIDESLSDMWGEFVDQTNGKGTDSAATKWLLGEDISGLGAIRDMKNPPHFGDPDMMTSGNYQKGDQENLNNVSYDNGGVHTNSGVNNKAVFLLTDGGSFNNYTIRGLGLNKVSAIYYFAETHLLTSGADYKDLYYALQQACNFVIGGPESVTTADCGEVLKAIKAVQMDKDPVSGFMPEAQVCPANTTPKYLFLDSFEAGANKWDLTHASPASYPWELISDYTSAGLKSLYGWDPFSTADSSAYLASPIRIPNTTETYYLYFQHSYGFDYGPDGSNVWRPWDGGVLEYQIDSGSWLDASGLFDSGRGYNGTIFNYTDGNNPLANRSAFVRDSHGFVSSRYILNKSTIKGHQILFRWRLGSDSSVSGLGWVIDDVRIYTCYTGPIHKIYLPVVIR